MVTEVQSGFESLRCIEGVVASVCLRVLRVSGLPKHPLSGERTAPGREAPRYSGPCHAGGRLDSVKEPECWEF